MKPPRFDYHAPLSLDEALELRSAFADDSVVLAGGQSLIPLLSMRLAMPGTVIDIGRIEALAGIAADNGTLALGAMARQRAAERSALVQEACPLLRQALLHVAHPTIRNRGTVGGSIAHADPAAELPAVATALDAQLVARSIRGERTIAAADFFLGPLTTALEPDELLVEVQLPRAAPRSGSAFVEVARRHGDFALVGAAASVTLAGDGTIAEARLAFTGVGGTPVRARDAESALADRAEIDEASRVAAEHLEPATDIHASASYRKRVAAVVARRALTQAAAAAGEERL